MKTHATAAVAVLMLLLPACQRAPGSAAASAGVPGVASLPYARHDWPLPITAAASQPDLVAADDGRLLLSWIEPQGEGHALRFAAFTPDVGAAASAHPPAHAGATGWSTPRTIATGNDWFVNWADTPHLARTADGALWAHWLRKSAAATYAYDIALVRSGDDGATWSKPVLVNDDGKPVEHGFVSLWPATPDAVGVAWLDGRNSAGGGHADHGRDMPGGAMTLRAARFDANLRRSGDTQIDAMTCDCCQTDVALTSRGQLLVYRDRDADEIRDIAVTRGGATGWSVPRPVHADRWTMPACPVNGPSVAARGEAAVVAWYTAPGDQPMLRLVRSADAGDTFAAPVTVDAGTALQGRVDVALDAHGAWVLWVREEAGAQSLHLARYLLDLQGVPARSQRIEVARIAGRGRATGFPQLALGTDAAYTVWTEVVDGRPRLRGALFRAQ